MCTNKTLSFQIADLQTHLAEDGRKWS